MSYNLVIVESPNKIKSIREYLTELYPSKKWEVAASVGHFTELSKKSGSGYITAGVFANTYLVDSVVSESKKSVFTKLKALVKGADTVYLASDNDREGEAIADALQGFLHIKAPVRVLFNEITRSGIKSAMDSPAGDINQDLVIAQRARRVLDRLVGFLVSPELYRLMGVSGASAGRVQSPVLRLIYERAKEISTFKPNSFFDVILTGESEGKAFKAKLNTKPFQDENSYFVDAALAQSFSSVTDLELANFNETERLKHPPSALTTSLMQQMASGLLKIKPKQVMQAAQGLFEVGLITYHRTDNPNIAAESFEFIKEKYSSLGVMPEQRVFPSSADAQEAHTAITPTDFDVEFAGSTETEKQLYSLIRTYAIASQLLPAKYKVRKAILKTKLGEHDLEFNATGSELVENGYLSFVKNMKDDNEDEEDSALLPDLNNGFKIVKGDCLSKQTKPPKIYTLKTLLARLAALGIGRPATLDSIFETLEQKQYIIVDGKNQLMPTELGEKILNRLVGQFEFIEYKFTSDMEKSLDLLAQGKADYISVLDGFYNKLNAEIKGMQQQKSDVVVNLCPECNSALRHVFKKGAYDFWGCTNKECKYTADNIDGKPVERKKAVLSNHSCPKCSEPLIHRFKADSHDFFGCSGFPKCDYSADNKDGVPVERPEPAAAEYHCPDCSKPLVRREGTNKNGAYDFYGCTGFREGCKKSFKTGEDGTPVLA